MNESETQRQGLLPIYLVKAARVCVSGLMSIIIPIYLGTLGYGHFFQGVALIAILSGGAASNLAVTYLDATLGRRRLLQLFSALMVAAGALLVLSTSVVSILIACLIGNISTTGTEAGPFQSIEAGVLPSLAPGSAVVKAFGRYNLVGYSAAAVGQLLSAGPGLFGNDILAFQASFFGFSAAGVVLLLVYSRLSSLEGGRTMRPGLGHLSPQSRKDLRSLSALFSVDAFGGTFVSTYLLTVWFNATFGLGLTSLGTLFFVASVIAAASVQAAAVIAQRIGNLRTMVYTHIVSSAFLLLMAFAGSLALALLFLFLRQSLSQMDVPSRQALMAEIFSEGERVQAYAVTNIFRTGGSFVGGPVATAILGTGFVTGILMAGGIPKIAYDLATFATFRKRYR